MSSNLLQNSTDLKDKNDFVLLIDEAHRIATVPAGWKRVSTSDNQIIYITPSSAVLSSIDQVTAYLLSDSTCKCGLSNCPIYLDQFNFDSSVASVEDSMVYDETKSNCKHNQKYKESLNQFNDTSTNSNLIYQPQKVIYTPTIQHTSNCNSITNQSNKIIIQDSNENMKTNYSTTMPILNYKSIESNQLTNITQQQQVFSYIPIRKDNLTNLTDFNLIGQPIYFASPIKKSSNNSSPVSSNHRILQVVDSSQLIQPIITINKQLNQQTKHS